MCFRKNKIEIKTAEEDIEVFKIVAKENRTGKLLSMYLNFPYKYGETYKSDIIIKDPKDTFTIYSNKLEVNIAIHSYSVLNSIENDEAYYFIMHKNNYANDDHTPISIVDYYEIHIGDDYTAVPVKCIIPKGAHYDFNERGEYISDEIILIEEFNVQE